MAGLTPEEAAGAAQDAADAAFEAAEKAQALADQARVLVEGGGAPLTTVFLQIALFALVALAAAAAGGVAASHREARQIVPVALAAAGLAGLIVVVAGMANPSFVGLDPGWIASTLKLAGMAVAVLGGSFAACCGLAFLARIDGFSPRLEQLQVTNKVFGAVLAVAALLAVTLIVIGQPVLLGVVCVMAGAAAAAFLVLPVEEGRLDRFIPASGAAAAAAIAGIGVMIGNVAFIGVGAVAAAVSLIVAFAGSSGLGSRG